MSRALLLIGVAKFEYGLRADGGAGCHRECGDECGEFEFHDISLLMGVGRHGYVEWVEIGERDALVRSV